MTKVKFNAEMIEETIVKEQLSFLTTVWLRNVCKLMIKVTDRAIEVNDKELLKLLNQIGIYEEI